MRQQLTMWLNLTTAMFFRLEVYWVSIAKPIYNIGIRFSPDCATRFPDCSKLILILPSP
nr:hypothetical protein DGKKSRWO_DGKKSRWO_CDS_0087 [uncultured phage]CAI9752264.1 hypothetical protein CVNMHQAP_CVNMHQAP_CDS_0087 [uncultured phage]